MNSFVKNNEIKYINETLSGHPNSGAFVPVKTKWFLEEITL